MNNDQNERTPRVFGVFALLAVASARTVFLLSPTGRAASLGLLSTLLSGLLGGFLAFLGYAAELGVYHKLGGSIYKTKKGRRHFGVNAAIVCSILAVLAYLYLQNAVYIQALRTFVFFRTPRFVLGAMLGAVVFLGTSMPTRALIRAAQLLIWPLVLIALAFLFPLGEFEFKNLYGLLQTPDLRLLSQIPLSTAFYTGSGALLILNDRRTVRAAQKVLPWFMLLRVVLFCASTTLIVTLLGTDLMRLAEFPALNYIQTVRTPGLERFDLAILFLTATAAASGSIMCGRAAVMGFSAFGLAQNFGAALLAALVILAASTPLLPGMIDILAQIAAALQLLSVLLFWLIPKSAGDKNG